MSIKLSVVNGKGDFATQTGAGEDDWQAFQTDFMSGSGIVNTGDFLVTEQSSPGMKVDVAKGVCYIENAAFVVNTFTTKYYCARSDDTEELNISSNASGSTRIDIVIVRKTAGAPGDDGDNVEVVVIEGTPGAGTPATPSNSKRLAVVTVADGATSIVNANIVNDTDKPSTVPDGAVTQAKLATSVLNLIHPVGSIYSSVVATNPGTLFGFGTWTAFGAGRVMVGFNSGDADFNAGGKTGGTKTHTLTATEMPSHSHAGSSLSADSAGAHTHALTYSEVAVSNSNSNIIRQLVSGSTSSTNTESSGAHSHSISGSTGNSGSSGSHNNLQPYITVFMWERTA